MALVLQQKGVEYGKYLLSVGVECDTSAFLALLDAIPHRDEFSLFWAARNPKTNPNEIIARLLQLAKLFEQRFGAGAFGEKKQLLVLAWRFGNDDNLIKLLPKELLKLIFEYDIDVPHWYSIGEIIGNDQRGKFYVSIQTIESALFIAKHRHFFHEKMLSNALSNICCLEKFFKDERLPKILRQLRKIDPNLTYEYSTYSVPGILYHFTRSTNTDLLEALLETKMMDTKFFTAIEHYREPRCWLACQNKNKEAIEVLCKYGLIPLEVNTQIYGGTVLRLEDWLIQKQAHDIYPFVLQCIEKNKQNKD